MKTIYEHTVGGDGAIAGLYADDQYLYETVKYPLSKALGAPEAAIDAQLTNLETKFPALKSGIENLKTAYKAAVAKFIGG